MECTVKNAKFKVTSPDYTQVMAGNKILTPDADGAYTVSAADGTQTIALTDSEGYSIYLSITVNADHTINNSDCTKEIDLLCLPANISGTDKP